LKLYLLLSGSIFALLILLLAGSREIARRLSSISPEAAILNVEACSQPCWHGIHPGVTTLDQAAENLRADQVLVANVLDVQLGDFASRRREICWEIRNQVDWRGCALRDQGFSGPINRLELEPPDEGLSLGDTILLFGNPIASEYCMRLGLYYAFVYFPDNVEVRTRGESPIQSGTTMPRYDPTMRVFIVRYHYPADEPPYAFDTPRWQGFTYPHGSDYNAFGLMMYSAVAVLVASGCHGRCKY
jgi:hypothetical protein